MITIDPVTPMSEIKSLMSNDDLWYRFSEGDGDFDDGYIEATNLQEYYGIMLDDYLVGTLKCDLIFDDILMIHPYVLEEYRHIAKDLIITVYRFLTWFRPEINYLMSAVPDCFPSVQRYQGLAGFREIADVHEGYYKDHEYHGLKYYINNNWKVS